MRPMFTDATSGNCASESEASAGLHLSRLWTELCELDDVNVGELRDEQRVRLGRRYVADVAQLDRQP